MSKRKHDQWQVSIDPNGSGFNVRRNVENWQYQTLRDTRGRRRRWQTEDAAQKVADKLNQESPK